METTDNISRRDFLRLGGASLAGLVFRNFASLPYPGVKNLGRVNAGMVEIKIRPDEDSQTVGKLYEDAVVPWLREVVGSRPYRANRRYVETPDGYIWAPYLQPVKNLINVPIESLPESSLGPGMWAEVSVPYLDVILANPPARSPWLQDSQRPRVYFTQVFWIDKINTDEQGQTWYRINERFGYGDLLWAKADGFRPLTADDIRPIRPKSADKRVFVDVNRQTLSCFEGKNEVFFTRVSTGMLNDLYGKPTEEWETPPGIRPIWRKLISAHMTGGSTGGGYDLAGVSFTTLFEGNGVAIHSTFWHNNFGEPMSHGCVNCQPEAAKWIFRWTLPEVTYDPGDLTVSMPGGTLVEVVN